MSRTSSNRLRRIEAAQLTGSRVVVVAGYSDAEHSAAIAALKAKGEASDRDQFVCLMRFAERTSA